MTVQHDFGHGYGGQNFVPAKLKGKNEKAEDGKVQTRPFVWGEERLRIELPRSGTDQGYGYHSPSLSVSRDLSKVAASYEELVSIFQLPDWDTLLVLHHENAVDRVSFSPDGKYLLTTSSGSRSAGGGGVTVWDIAAETARQKKDRKKEPRRANMEKVQGRMVQTSKYALLEYKEDWTEDSWLRDAQTLITDGAKDLLAKVERRHLEATGENVRIKGMSVSSFGTDPWSPDGSQLVFLRPWEPKRIPPGTNGVPSDLVLWDLSSNKQAMDVEQPGHEGPVMWSGFSPDGKWVASSSWDKKIRLWNAKTGRLHFVLQDDARGQSWTGRFSPNSRYLAVGNGDGHLRVWNAGSGKLEHKVVIEQAERRNWIRGIEFTSDSKSIFFSDGGGNAELYNLETERVSQLYIVGGSSFNEMQEVQVSPSGTSLGFRIQSGQMTVYDIRRNEKWQVEQTLDKDRDLRKPAFGIMRFVDEEGREAVSYDKEGILRIWRLKE